MASAPPRDRALRCGTCESGPLERVLDLGKQPVSSHYTGIPGAPVVQHDVALSVCANCGVVQLEKPYPFRDLVPPFDWITYREPEDHLDSVAARIRALPGVGAHSRLVGLSFKDRSTVERLAALGLGQARMLDPYRDMGADYPNANIESVAGFLNTGLARELGRTYPADIVIARHIVEHAPSCGRFLSALRELLTPDGYLIIEVPDCSGNLTRQDYTMIWEEHSYYFTAATAPQILARAGFTVLGFDIHPYAFEDVIVLYARKTEQAPGWTDFIAADVVARNNAMAHRFGAAFPDWSRRYAELFGKITADGRKLAAYGAGHLTCAFLHFHGVARYFEFVVDDTPQKQNLFLPKSGLPIVPRDRLTPDRIAACLFGLSPQAEDRVIANNQAFLESGGKFYSIFADSKRSIRALL
jgi:C-methyltransferase C-terminal domain/Methyltransferase domain/Putative zinc binding domain